MHENWGSWLFWSRSLFPVSPETHSSCKLASSVLVSVTRAPAKEELTIEKNVGDGLGILRDDQLLYSDRLQLWNNFNICWLSVCQKQKDMTTDLLQIGHQPPNTSLLSTDVMENMAKSLIQLCDKMEQHGLVDYQMGIWEEEILSGM